MSSSILDSLLQIPTADTIKADHHIALIDQEKSQGEEGQEEEEAERDDSEAPTAPSTPGPSPLVKKLTRNSTALQTSVKRELTRRKYAKYGQDRYVDDEAQPPEVEDPSTQQAQPGEGAATPPAPQQPTSFSQRAATLLKRKRTLPTNKTTADPSSNTTLDILYENQRGFFLFGIPKYSSSSLLPTDPKPWQNVLFRSSPTDIRNATPPDPSWEWVWKSWYVDMNRDVDEEGWEYSMQFFGGWSWHGSSPWFSSFVRRRRWVRLRRRKNKSLHVRGGEKGHELTAEYFTIHPRTLRPASDDWSRGPSTSTPAPNLLQKEKEDEDDSDVTTIGALLLALKNSAVDREKLVAVRNFVDTAADDELYYLADRMQDIMALFVYQSSRRQLLTDLLSRHGEAHRRRESLDAHTHGDDDEEAGRQHEAESKRAENLENAIHVADEQVKKLEFWSDIKSMAGEGDALLLLEGEGRWDGEKWQGLSPTLTAGSGHLVEAFASKQAAGEGARELHRHAEHADVGGKGKEKEKEKIGDGRDGRDDETEMRGERESSEDRYTTAAESVSEIIGKGKGKARVGLDGVDEEDGDEEAAVPDAPPRVRKQSVQILEPVSEPELSSQDPTTVSTSSTSAQTKRGDAEAEGEGTRS